MANESLTEFLLARIAEDEAVARAVVTPSSMHLAGFSPMRAMLSPHDYPGSHDGPVVGISTSPARVLAECEAKRRIVQDSLRLRPLLQIAAVYADHPDYREGWRP